MNKTFIFIFSWAIVMVAEAFDEVEEYRRVEAEQVSMWERNFASAKGKPSHEKKFSLRLGLRNMGYRRSLAGHDSTVDVIYEKIRNEMLATPGHAQYFADALEEERTKFRPNASYGTYTYNVSLYLSETLVHLPSPETIKVLGHYLNDDRDNPESPYPKSDFAPYPGTSMIAFGAISKIGLRDLPELDLEVADPDSRNYQTMEKFYEAMSQVIVLKQHKKEEALGLYRVWWQEVKSGQRTFSFKGQNVEHRFKPDGTWDTIPISNPPDDAVKPPKLTPRPAPEKAPEQDVQPSKPEDVPNWWPWLWIPALAIVAVGVRMFSRRASAQ